MNGASDLYFEIFGQAPSTGVVGTVSESALEATDCPAAFPARTVIA